MAATAGLTGANVKPVYTAGLANKVALYALADVTANDTIDLATIGDGASFMVIKSAVVMGESDFVEIAAQFAGTVITMPGGLNQSTGYLLVLGC
jgi:hypothetical protein